MDTALWIAQIVLAIAFLMAGGMKLAQPKEQLLLKMAWVEDFSQPMIRLISALEILGARVASPSSSPGDDSPIGRCKAASASDECFRDVPGPP